MNLKQLAKELELTRKDRIGILVLFFLIILCIYLPSLIVPKNQDPFSSSDTAWISAIRQLEHREKADDAEEDQTLGFRRGKERNDAALPITPFVFDPNTLDESGWKRLGIPDRTIRTILNYREKGGRFRVREDLRKIYGIRPEQYQVLERYIRIETPPNVYPKKEENSFSFERSKRKYETIDVNLADTSAFISLPGIGSKLAGRIVSFREKLGGFYKIEQVREVYGLADSVFQNIKQYLKLENASFRKININTCTEEQLRSHPYFRSTLAKPIIAYRETHGNFKSVDEIRNLMPVSDEQFEKIKPYLSL